MKNIRLPLALLSIATLSAILLGQTTAPAAPPRSLAVVNLVDVFKKLDEKEAMQGAFEKMSTEFTNEKTKREAEVEKLKKDLDNPNLFKPGSPEFVKMQDDLLKKASDLKAFIEYAQTKMAIEQRVKTVALYNRINEAITAYSQTHDIALVFVIDDGNFNDAANVQEILLRANSRKVIYAHPSYDITKNIVDKMNTDFMLGTINAGRGTATRPK